MAEHKPLNRRSFVRALVGTAIGGGALAAVTGAPSTASATPRPCPRFTGVSDDDGVRFMGTGDHSGCGRNNVTDADSRDPAGYGRNFDPVTNMTDRDTTDAIGRGTGRNGSGVSDNDANDRAGFGRNTSAPRQPGGYGGRVFTGRNDSDSGARADQAGYGR